MQTLIFLFLMAIIKCPGCNRQFDSTAGLVTHKCYCKSKITATATRLLQTWKANLEKRAEAKQQQIEEKPAQNVEDLVLNRLDGEGENWVDKVGPDDDMPIPVHIVLFC